jgi:hypothetical protein
VTRRLPYCFRSASVAAYEQAQFSSRRATCRPTRNDADPAAYAHTPRQPNTCTLLNVAREPAAPYAPHDIHSACAGRQKQQPLQRIAVAHVRLNHVVDQRE